MRRLPDFIIIIREKTFGSKAKRKILRKKYESEKRGVDGVKKKDKIEVEAIGSAGCGGRAAGQNKA